MCEMIHMMYDVPLFIDKCFCSDISTKTSTKVIVLLAKFYYVRSNIIMNEMIILT